MLRRDLLLSRNSPTISQGEIARVSNSTFQINSNVKTPRKTQRKFFGIGNVIVLWNLVLAISLLGCSSSKEETKKKETFEEFLARYEKTFDPSKYKVPLNLEEISSKKNVTTSPLDSLYISTLPETLAGFRVQVMFTQDIDQATQMRDSLNVLLPDDWVYIVFDSPYYKVRVGNYLDRPSANKMVRVLVGKGFKDAWVVPDVVIKNAGQKQMTLPSDSLQSNHNK
jgi:hypothetical protein